MAPVAAQINNTISAYRYSKRRGATSHQAGSDTPPEFDLVKVEVAVRRKRKIYLVVDDRVAAVLLSTREQLEPDAPACSVEWGV